MILTLDEGLHGGFWATDEDGNRYTCSTVYQPSVYAPFAGVFIPASMRTFWRLSFEGERNVWADSAEGRET